MKPRAGFQAVILVMLVFAKGALCQGEPRTIAPLSRARVAEVATMLPEQPEGFGPPCANRTAWASRAARLTREIAQAEGLLAKPLPAWNDEAYLEFSRKGTRGNGEAMLRAHDGQLSTLVLAECSEWKGRFLPRVEEQLNAIADQRSWTLPAHDGKLENFNGTRYYVDLGAASLGHAVAEALYLLGDRVTRRTRDHVMAALDAHMFGPMRTAISGGHREFWYDASSNWNAVCWNGVAGAALTVLPDRKDRASFAAAAEQYSNGYLGSYTESGYAEEGIGYWGYGFSNYEELREHLWLATQGKIDLYNSPKAQKAALFPFQFQMLPRVYADFGDARFQTEPDQALMRRIDSIFDLHVMPPEAVDQPISGALPGATLAAFPVPSQRPAAGGKSGYDALIGLRTYYPDAGVLVSRPPSGGHLGVTIKAGGNGGHSHNDIGSYSIGLGSTQPVGDPGGPLFYTAETFSSKRFESKLLNSFGHPVPTIDDGLQLEATKVSAPVLATSFSEDRDTIAIDLTKAYGSPKLRKVIRTLDYNRPEGQVVIEDRFDVSGPVDLEEAFPTHGTWKQIGPGTLRFDLDDAHLVVAVSGAQVSKVTSEQIGDYGQPFTRVGVRLHLDQSGVIRMKFAAVP